MRASNHLKAWAVMRNNGCRKSLEDKCQGGMHCGATSSSEAFPSFEGACQMAMIRWIAASEESGFFSKLAISRRSFNNRSPGVLIPKLY